MWKKMNGSSFCCINNNNNNRRNPKRNEFPYFDLILLYCRGREIVWIFCFRIGLNLWFNDAKWPWMMLFMHENGKEYEILKKFLVIGLRILVEWKLNKVVMLVVLLIKIESLVVQRSGDWTIAWIPHMHILQVGASHLVFSIYVNSLVSEFIVLLLR